MNIDMPADYEDFKESVLSDCRTEGLGVYEVWWLANSRYPALPVSARLHVAEQVVKNLLEAGDIRLVQGRWIGPEHERQPIADGVTALLEAATWLPEQDNVVWIEPADWDSTPTH